MRHDLLAYMTTGSVVPFKLCPVLGFSSLLFGIFHCHACCSRISMQVCHTSEEKEKVKTLRQTDFIGEHVLCDVHIALILIIKISVRIWQDIGQYVVCLFYFNFNFFFFFWTETKQKTTNHEVKKQKQKQNRERR